MQELILYAVLAFTGVITLIPVAGFLAVKTGFIDQPGGRKKHEKAVPPIGGLVIFPVFILLSLMAGVSSSYGWFLLALSIVVIGGAIDDKRHIPARIKFIIQIIAALLIVFPGGATVYYLGNLAGFGPFGLGIFGPAFSVLAVVLLINAINLVDGLDGLAGGLSFVVLAWLLYACATGSGGAENIPYLAALAGGLAGFLFYNIRHPFRHKASVFLGDSGSMALGLALAWFSIRAAQYPTLVIEPVAVAWLLALPIFDTCGQFARRLRLGRHPFSPDDHHFHHHFIYAGLTPGKTTAVIILLAIAFGAIGVGGIAAGLPVYVLAFAWVILLFLHIYMSMRPHRFRRLVKSWRTRLGGNPKAETQRQEP